MKTRAKSPPPPDQAFCREILLERYAAPGERSVRAIQTRVARALASVEAADQRALWSARFVAAMRSGFIPGGRIHANAGTGHPATLINCFVQPVAGQWGGRDEHDRPGVREALSEGLRTMSLGGGIGLDLSSLPPTNVQPEGANSPPCDPLSVIARFDRECRILSANGQRRGAQMAVLSVDHPDIEAFIDAKRPSGLSTFNTSVAITDGFMRRVQDDTLTELVHPMPPTGGIALGIASGGQFIHARLPARTLWTQLLDAAWNCGSPGLIFIDQVNRDNNLSWIESLRACNPCGEQYLPDYGACDLGSINLARLVEAPFTPKSRFDFSALRRIVPLAVRALDNVIDLTHWPLPQQAVEARLKRRTGLGFTGLGDALCMMGLPYDSEQARELAASVARSLRDWAYEASSQLARERGAFPLFEAEPFLCPEHAASRLPAHLRESIRLHGLRNSHLLSIAPAGTISIAFGGNVSSGIEPAFSGRFHRRRRVADERLVGEEVEDYAWRLYRLTNPGGPPTPPAWRDTLQISPESHLAMLAAVQPFIDGAISKTVQIGPDYSRTELDELVIAAWRRRVKGLSVYRPTGRADAVLWASRCARADANTGSPAVAPQPAD